MKIINKNNQIVEGPDLEKGFLLPDKILVAHHDAIPAVEEQWHHDVTAVYSNGGKDVVKVVDIEGAPERAAWDEYEDVLRYIEFSAKELDRKAAEKAEMEKEAQRIPNLEKENKLLKEQVNALSSQNDFQEELIVELANIVYA